MYTEIPVNPYSILAFFSVYHASIESLEISAGTRFVPILREIFNTLKFPKLAHLSIEDVFENEFVSETMEDDKTAPDLLEFPSLVSFKIIVDDRHYDYRHFVYLMNFIQLLLNRGGKNLQELEVKGNTLPGLDLSRCSSLRKIENVVVLILPYGQRNKRPFTPIVDSEWMTGFVDKLNQVRRKTVSYML
jgi:hypothetical protein